MTKDNWIKALPKEAKYILLQVADGALSMEGVRADEYTLDMIDRENEKGIYKQMIAFISQVVKDTEKRKDEEWRKKIESKMIRHKDGRLADVTQGHNKFLSDLLKEKESA